MDSIPQNGNQSELQEFFSGTYKVIDSLIHLNAVFNFLGRIPISFPHSEKNIHYQFAFIAATYPTDSTSVEYFLSRGEEQEKDLRFYFYFT